jgi:hypothetical protein
MALEARQRVIDASCDLAGVYGVKIAQPLPAASCGLFRLRYSTSQTMMRRTNAVTLGAFFYPKLDINSRTLTRVRAFPFHRHRFPYHPLCLSRNSPA